MVYLGVGASARGARRRKLDVQAAIVAVGGAVPATRGVGCGSVLHFVEGHGGLLAPRTVCCAYAMHSYDHSTRRVQAKLLDDGIGDTLVSVGATIALHDIPWPHELAWRNTRETSDVRAVCWCGGRTRAEPRWREGHTSCCWRGAR